MSRKRIVLAVGAVVILVIIGWVVVQRRASAEPAYRFATVERGTIQQTVSATGALSAVKTVQVGTQVSGQVAEIKADFNDHVTKGQLLARIDPTLQQQAVTDAQAQLAKTQAQYQQAKQEYDRNQPLFAQKFISASEFSTVQVNLSVALAGMRSAQVTLDRAKQNLSYTNIHAPISGVVVERDVDVGQTVAASLSAPQLFLIAQDLSRMQILAAVDESDIAAIKDSQDVTFTVQPYPGRTFKGQVEQVRLQSKLTDNVVNYTVVVTLDNPGGVLLPGMTATVQFITGSAVNVLTVPNLALRYKPSPEQLAAAGIAASDTSTRRSDSAGRRGGGGTGSTGGTGGPVTTAPVTGGQTGGRAGGTGTAAARPRRSTFGGVGSSGTLYTVDSTSRLKAVRVRIGLSDGQRTQVSGDGVREGMRVIVGAATTATPATTAPASNPLTPQRGGGRGGP
ncbi:MAG: HlyD family secretion protein [Gemmatimonadetes bacterium]|nr:HlyD family secretion protein [Gemmatimonadota bacterium]